MYTSLPQAFGLTRGKLGAVPAGVFHCTFKLALLLYFLGACMWLPSVCHWQFSHCVSGRFVIHWTNSFPDDLRGTGTGAVEVRMNASAPLSGFRYVKLDVAVCMQCCSHCTDSHIDGTHSSLQAGSFGE